MSRRSRPPLFAGDAWFDPIEVGIRERVRGFIEELLEQELTAMLGRGKSERAAGEPKGYRNGTRERQLLGSFGPVEVEVPRARMAAADGGIKEWRSASLPRYARMTKQVEALVAGAYLVGTNTRRVKRALSALFGGAVGKDVAQIAVRFRWVSRTWRKVRTDWDAWNKHTGLDLRARPLAFLTEHFGKSGDYLYGVARGVDDRPVQANRVRKSVGAERTFEQDMLIWEEVEPALAPVFAQVWAACTRGGHMGRTVTVKVKYADFQQVTRSRSGAGSVAAQLMLEQVSLDLLRPLFLSRLGVRLLGVTLSNLDGKPCQDAAQLALSF